MRLRQCAQSTPCRLPTFSPTHAKFPLTPWWKLCTKRAKTSTSAIAKRQVADLQKVTVTPVCATPKCAKRNDKETALDMRFFHFNHVLQISEKLKKRFFSFFSFSIFSRHIFNNLLLNYQSNRPQNYTMYIN